jgi:hypothetical protein
MASMDGGDARVTWLDGTVRSIIQSVESVAACCESRIEKEHEGCQSTRAPRNPHSFRRSDWSIEAPQIGRSLRRNYRLRPVSQQRVPQFERHSSGCQPILVSPDS